MQFATRPVSLAVGPRWNAGRHGGLTMADRGAREESMNRLARILLLFAMAPTEMLLPAPAPEVPGKPRLVVAITVDQFRYDYLTRFRGEYAGGFKRLLAGGAVYTNARYEHFPTVTAVGHSTILSGATPSLSGIVGNDWYDRDAGKQTTSVQDDNEKIVGGSGEVGASPRRLLVSTVGDELKMGFGKQCHVAGISLKDRAAILPVGHMADAAYWFEARSGAMVTSTYYMPTLPDWVKEFNRSGTNRYRGAEWMGRKLPSDAKVNGVLASSPFGNEFLEEFAERLIDAERFGADSSTDLLSVSFSSIDYVGHSFGPNSPEVRDMCIRLDAVIEKLFRFVDARVGLRNVVFLLLSDHGVAPMPEFLAANRMPGGRLAPRIVQDSVEQALTKQYGAAKWILSPSEHSVTLNYAAIEEKKLNYEEVVRVARDAILPIPHVLRVYTKPQLINGGVLEDQFGRRVMESFHLRRSADLYIFLEAYWIFGRSGTTHGTAYNYDSHVPVILMGPGIHPGQYNRNVAVNDVAPTLSTLMEIETPSGSVGHVLTECLETYPASKK
jgi:hypothetical protein